MNDAAARLLESEIEVAFGAVPYPGHESLLDQSAHHTLEEQEISSYFSGRHWSELEPERVIYHHEAIFFLSPEAFQFFLPGYLIACIRSTEVLSCALGAIEQAFTFSQYYTPDEVLRERIDQLPLRQREELLRKMGGSIDILFPRAAEQGLHDQAVRSRVAILTPRQRTAVLHFFEFLGREHPETFSSDELEAVRRTLVFQTER